jgi:hypothetical protein
MAKTKETPAAPAPAAPPPAAAPTSTPAPEAPIGAGAAPVPSGEAAYDGGADDAAALAILKGSARVEEGSETPTEVAPAAVEPEAETAPASKDPWASLKAFSDPEPENPQGDLPPEDARLVRALQMLQAQERELIQRRQADSLSAEEVAEAKRLLAAKKAAKTDPEVWFREAGWDQETIGEYIRTGGQAPLKPIQAEVDAKVGALEKKIQELQGYLEHQQRTAAIQQFKGVIPQHISANEADYPHLAAYYESPIEQMEAVWSVIEQSRTVEKKNLSVAEAATRLETVLAKEAAKLARAKSKTAPPATQKSAKTPTPTLTNQGGAAPSSTTDDEDWRSLDQRALTEYRQALRATQTQ